MIVLDTNLVSEASKPSPDRNVSAWFDRQDTLQLYLCSPVVMEQSFGAERILLRTGSQRYFLILERLASAQFRGRILSFDENAALMTSKLRATRERSGQPISAVDAMIAAICIVHGAALATRNVRDFEGLDLKLVNPFEAGA